MTRFRKDCNTKICFNVLRSMDRFGQCISVYFRTISSTRKLQKHFFREYPERCKKVSFVMSLKCRQLTLASYFYKRIPSAAVANTFLLLHKSKKFSTSPARSQPKLETRIVCGMCSSIKRRFPPNAVIEFLLEPFKNYPNALALFRCSLASALVRLSRKL